MSEELLQDFQRDYEVEFSESDAPNTQVNSNEDERAFKVERFSVKYQDGDNEVGLPWRDHGNELTNNRILAESRLLLLKRRFERNPEFKIKYDETIQEHEIKGYISRVDTLTTSKKRWYL
ncbi:hypothetical protein, partial [Streptococcus dysgalactiae]|uniref:hypothetical protein n=1 Tax=Streptococcus dysgalactiae TaxID=1334 RepID=UPI00194DC109